MHRASPSFTSQVGHTFQMAGNLRPLVAYLSVHLEEHLVFLLGPGAAIQAVLKIIRVPLAALLVGPTPHQLRHLQGQNCRTIGDKNLFAIYTLQRLDPILLTQTMPQRASKRFLGAGSKRLVGVASRIRDTTPTHGRTTSSCTARDEL